jgi:hypothetical protein
MRTKHTKQPPDEPGVQHEAAEDRAEVPAVEQHDEAPGLHPFPVASTSHNAAVLAAENARQSAVRAAGLTQAQANAAEIQFHRTVLASVYQNNSGAGAEPHVHALMSLGTGGT